ncbi:alpha-ketoglutarate-dependent dioxygenase AlkB [Arenicella chitinivorans]|uniref:Alpha-ketoglutarate-dependent dioxygenase AlkB n=1 Tax=Arenicella chitinivorans TaxID=1329800 RepID=A0A918RVH1_9GAMM|nr:alpha-ketoglutarate-dependent dioxygenase AlkB [Arenicella chitinivorans]GHA10816.1 alpha-ketoglutarate-dependent dioxygenase AlkB [Arenicella chitinivorans]
MASTTKQLGLLSKQTHVLNLEDADIRYTPEFYSTEVANTLFDVLLNETDWQQDTVRVFGKKHLAPRLSRWVGDPGLRYAYSGLTMETVPWTDTLLAIRADAEGACGASFNSVLLNFYRDGRDSNGWHSDDEPELGGQPQIASLSFGAARDFRLRHKTDPQLKYTLALENGSLLFMCGPTQANWQHHIPKRANAGPRINLTFRSIVE